MDSQKLAGVWASIIAAIVLAAAFYYVPRNDQFAVRPGALAAKPVEKAAAPAPAVRGPVVREVPNGTDAPTDAPAAPGVRGPVVREVPQ
jgi:hypothetical protein